MSLTLASHSGGILASRTIRSTAGGAPARRGRWSRMRPAHSTTSSLSMSAIGRPENKVAAIDRAPPMLKSGRTLIMTPRPADGSRGIPTGARSSHEMAKRLGLPVVPLVAIRTAWLSVDVVSIGITAGGGRYSAIGCSKSDRNSTQMAFRQASERPGRAQSSLSAITIAGARSTISAMIASSGPSGDISVTHRPWAHSAMVEATLFGRCRRMRTVETTESVWARACLRNASICPT